MNRESVSLALAGVLLGVLALSATLFARLHPATREALAADPAASTAALAAAQEPLAGTEAFTAAREPASAAGVEESEAAQEVVPVLATCDPAADGAEDAAFFVALTVPDPAPGEKLFLCDGLSCPLAGIEPDQDGDATLGPFPPGRYCIQCGDTELGHFRLLENAALSEADGRAWTDGERLYLERFTPGTVRLTVRLHGTGRYSLELRDRDGRVWSRELFIPDGSPADGDGVWVRVVEFQGLPAGLYTAVRENHPLGQTELCAGGLAELGLEIDK